MYYKLRQEYKKEMNALGWRLLTSASMPGYYVFKRGTQKLYIDCTKFKITTDDKDEDVFGSELSYETLIIIMDILRDAYTLYLANNKGGK